MDLITTESGMSLAEEATLAMLAGLLEDVYDTKPFVEQGFVVAPNQDRARMLIGFEPLPTSVHILEEWDGMVESFSSTIPAGYDRFEFHVNVRLIRRRDGRHLDEETTLRITDEWIRGCNLHTDLRPGRLFKWYVGTDFEDNRISYVMLLDQPQFTYAYNRRYDG